MQNEKYISERGPISADIAKRDKFFVWHVKSR